MLNKKKTPLNIRLKNGKEFKISKKKLVSYISIGLLVLAHIAIVLAIILSWRYYSIYPSLFGSVVGIIACLMIIIDIIFFVGFNHKDMVLKIVSATMALLLMIGGFFGTYYLSRANGIVDNVLDDGKSDKYETFSGVFVYNSKVEGNKFTSLADLSGKRVGLLNESSNGITYIAKNLLSKEKIDYATIDFNTSAEMLQGLIDGDVDAIVITSGYRSIFATKEGSTEEEASPFDKYLDDLVDFYSFEEELKVDTNRSSKNLSKDPFNVLLIGYSRTDIGSSVGLADSIILATINPQTYTVSMTSIARDSFVPISCYGGSYDKINSGRSTSRACFIETVENFIGMEVDYYMELDYLGLVAIVNTIGGIWIDNPVEFELDGILVPEGHLLADGQQALQFCRERHHMPNGDFDRQQHQKEVIMAIAQTFIESGSVTLALDAMESASDWMSTDFTLSQLTSIFNLLLNTKNYTSLDTFDLVDFHNLRITGYGGIMYYSMSMRLPLWVYLIYQESYDEAMNHVNDVLGKFSTINQAYAFEYSAHNPYERDPFYSTEYDNTAVLYEPDPMPAYWPSLDGYTLAEAMSWASTNGVSLSVEYINLGDEGYVESLQGLVVDQSPRYGSLVSEYSSGTITIMGAAEIDESKYLPDFVGSSYSKAVNWAREYGVDYSIDFNTDVDGDVGKVVSQSPRSYTAIENIGTLKIVVKAGQYDIDFNKNGHGSDSDVPDTITVTTGDKSVSLPSMGTATESNGDKYYFLGWYTEKDGGSEVEETGDVSGDVTLYAHWELDCNHEYEVVTKATCENEGLQKCKKCGKESTIAALGHDWGDTVVDTPATCTTTGSGTQTCKNDSSHTRPVEIPVLDDDSCKTSDSDSTTDNS